LHLSAWNLDAGKTQWQLVQCRQIQVSASVADTHVRRDDKTAISRVTSGGTTYHNQVRAA